MAHTLFDMGAPKKPEIKAKDLQGFKYFKALLPVLSDLHDHGCDRDRAGNRQLHYDQHVALILLYFFNPIVSSLRGIQQASELKKVQRLLGCPRASLGSLSEANRVFDAEVLRHIIGDMVAQLSPLRQHAEIKDIQGIVTLVDGSLLPALPKVVGAMWLDEKHRAFKLHTHYEALKDVPVRLDVTPANVGERTVLRAALQADRVYVMDRGYAAFALFRAIIDIGSSFVCRIRDNSVYEVVEERPLSAEATAGGIVRDVLVRFTGQEAISNELPPLRLVQIQCRPHRKRAHTGRGGPEQGEHLLIATDMVEVPADVIGLLYKHRWQIELFFRFFKHVLGCRHLISHDSNGIEIQTYVAIIACLLIALWTGKKPTLRTYEMLCYYFIGLADADELLAHIQKLQAQAL